MKNIKFKKFIDLLFYLAKFCLIVLIIIMPIEAITAAREIGVAGLAICISLYIWIVSPSKIFLHSTPLALPLTFYVITAILSLFTAIDFFYSLSEIRAEIAKGLVLFYSGIYFIQHERHLRQAWVALLIGASLMSVAGILLFFVSKNNSLDPFIRASSLHNGYGGFGTYLVTIWPYLILAPIALNKNNLRFWLLILIFLTISSAYLTYSRATWLSMICEFFLCYFIINKRYRLKNILYGGIIALFLIGGLFLTPGSCHGERWAKFFYEPKNIGGTVGDLFVLWEHAIKELQKRPFWGIGLGRHSFSKAFREFRESHQPLLWHAHNMFLDSALQLGLQGLATIIWIIITIIVVLWPRSPLKKGETLHLFGAATAIMTIGFSIRNFFDNFFADDSSQFFWLLTGLAFGGRAILTQAPDNTKG